MNYIARNGWTFHIAAIIIMISACLCFQPFSSVLGSAASFSTIAAADCVDTGIISFDTCKLSSTTQADWKDKYTTLVNGVETTVKKASETINAAKTYLGDPVDMVTGEFYTEETPDFQIKGRGLDLSIARKYKSKTIYNGPFGYGWTWNHGERILPLTGGDVLYYDNDGDAQEINSNGDGTYTYPKGSQFVLTMESGEYVITRNRTRLRSFFSGQGYLIRKADRFGNTLTFEYNNAGHPEQLTHIKDNLLVNGQPRSLELTYNSSGKVTSVTDFEGRTCSYHYLGDDLIEFRGLDYQASPGNATRYEYLSGQANEFLNHNMTKYTLPGGDYLEIGYYKNDQAAFHRNAKGETFNFMYSRLNRYAETWNEEGYYRKLFFNEANDVIRIANEDGTIEQMAYDEYGHHNKISHTDGNGYTTTFQYYPEGTAEPAREAFVKNRNLYLKTDALGRTWKYRYDDANNPYAPSQATDPADHITRFEYYTNGSLHKKIQAPGYKFDDDGGLVEDATAQGFVTAYEYDAYGHTIKITDPLNKFEERIYDTANNLYLMVLKDKRGNETRYQYYEDFSENMPIGALKSKTVISGTKEYTTTYQYDPLGRKTRETDPLLQETEYQYTLDGKLKKIIKPNQAVTEHIYDTARDIVSGAQIIETIDPLGNSEHFSYDATGKLIKKQDKNGNTYTFSYDAMGRLAKEVDPFRTIRMYTYDGNGNKTSVRLYDQAGELLKETRFTYDAANQLVEKTIPCQFEEDACEKVIQYQYSLDGKPEKETILFPDEEADLVSFYEYNALGHLKQSTTGYGTDDARTTQYRHDALGRLTRTILPLGNSKQNEYDANGNVTEIRFFDRNGNLLEETSHLYDARNLLEGTVNPLGDSIYYSHDALGRKDSQSQVLASGDVIEYQWQYDEVGNVIQETDPLGRLTRHGYDLNGRKTRTVDALGQTVAFEYDPNGNQTAVTWPDQSRTTTYYDALNRKIGVEDELGHVQVFDYDEASNLVTLQDARGNITNFEYDAANRLRRKTNALGNTEETGYDPADRVREKTDARGITTLLDYDTAGNLTCRTLAADTEDETVIRFEYDLNNQKEREIHETDGTDLITAFQYDDRGLLTHRKEGFQTGAPEIWTYGYDEARQLVSTTDPNGNTTRVFYDTAGRKSAQTQAQGMIEYYWEYDLAGNVTLERKPEGEEVLSAYDALNRLVLETRGDDQRRFEYDSRGRLTREENFNGDATEYLYDQAGRMIQETKATGSVDEAVSIYDYDQNGNLIAITNPLSKIVAFEYDELNQRIKEADSDTSRFKTITYDENGNIKTVKKRDGTDIEFVWDNLNRKEATKVDTVIRQTFDYDVLSRLVSATDTNQGTVTHTATFDYNDYGRLETEAQDSYTIGKLYDNNGNKIQITYPSGRVVDKTYNENNALTQILYQGTTIANLTRDRNSRLTAASFGNGTGLALDYDTRERETLRTYTDTLFSQETGYDAQSNILEETLALNGTTREKEYTYDHQDRLVTATPSTTWDYDSVGNWLSTNQNGTAESRTANDDNEYTLVDGTAFIHDPNGNLTSDGEKDYVYDWANRLIQVEESGQVLAEYTYDAVNRRVTKTVGTTVTTYVYDETEVIEEYTGGTLSRSYVYSSSIDKPILLETGSQFYYYIADRQGSVWGLTDNTGSLVESYEYTPFGLMTIYDSQGLDITATGSAIGNPFGFTGRRWDSESGLWYYRNRMYSAELGRFLQRDPAGYVDGLNLYQYCLNNPLRYTDPDGLMAKAAYDWTSENVLDPSSAYVSEAVTYYDNKWNNDYIDTSSIIYTSENITKNSIIASSRSLLELTRTITGTIAVTGERLGSGLKASFQRNELYENPTSFKEFLSVGKDSGINLVSYSATGSLESIETGLFLGEITAEIGTNIINAETGENYEGIATDLRQCRIITNAISTEVLDQTNNLIMGKGQDVPFFTSARKDISSRSTLNRTEISTLFGDIAYDSIIFMKQWHNLNKK